MDLERDSLGVEDGSADCAVLSEVIEHINPYYVNHTLSEINRILKVGGKLIVSYPPLKGVSFQRLE